MEANLHDVESDPVTITIHKNVAEFLTTIQTEYNSAQRICGGDDEPLHTLNDVILMLVDMFYAHLYREKAEGVTESRRERPTEKTDALK